MARLSAAARFSLATEPTTADAVRRLNATLLSAGADGRFITFVVGVIDLHSFQSTWVNAGHVTPLCRRASGQIELIGEAHADVPLGVFERPYMESALQLNPGDSVVVCTDGVIEARNTAGELYGLPRLRSKLATAPVDVSALGIAILADVRTFAGGRAADDDLALVCFGRTSAA
jgi:serine phosphatase RsbU (regulator of sigma subunit)